MTSEHQSNPEQRTDEEGTATEALPRQRPRIYVASLSDYNNGVLHGAWLNADQDVEELYEAVGAMLEDSRQPVAEEWAIHDYEGFGPLRLSEYESLERVSQVALGIKEHGPAFAAWAELVGQESGELTRFEEAYRGHWSSIEAYAEDLLDDLGATEVLEAIPEWLRPYVIINTAGFARDLELGGDIQAEEGEDGVWIFEGHL